MGNDKMRVIGAMTQKGGAGKSTLIKALASAAIAGGHSAVLIDADPQQTLLHWCRDIASDALKSGKLIVRAVSSAEEAGELIESYYEAGKTDFIFVDTKGEGAEWSDRLAPILDVIVMPIMLSKTDLHIAAQTFGWYNGLKSRVDDPSLLPPFVAVLNRVKVKSSKGDDELLAMVVREFPVVETIVLERNAYTEMDRFGLLGEIATAKAGDANPLIRTHAKHFLEALQESTDLLNNILAA